MSSDNTKLSIFDEIFIRINIWIRHKNEIYLLNMQRQFFVLFVAHSIRSCQFHSTLGVIYDITFPSNGNTFKSKWIGSRKHWRGSSFFLSRYDSSYLIKPFWKQFAVQNLCFQFTFILMNVTFQNILSFFLGNVLKVLLLWKNYHEIGYC